MGAIERFCKDLRENALRILTSEDAEAPNIIEACIWYLAGLSEEEKANIYKRCEGQFAKLLLLNSSLKHRSWPVGEYNDLCVEFMMWAPGARTRPHTHNGSFARIRVLAGRFCRFRCFLDNNKRKMDEFPQGDCGPGADMFESPIDIHAVCNN